MVPAWLYIAFIRTQETLGAKTWEAALSPLAIRALPCFLRLTSNLPAYYILGIFYWIYVFIIDSAAGIKDFRLRHRISMAMGTKHDATYKSIFSESRPLPIALKIHVFYRGLNVVQKDSQ